MIDDRTRHRIQLAVAGLLATALVPALAVVGSAADSPSLEDVKLSAEGGYISHALLAIDSDGDGWSDWYERLQGTDPKDPASHPGASHLEIISTTAFVQSTTFPDHLAMIDVALPEGSTKIENLLDVVGTVAGLSPTGKLHAQLEEGLASVVGSGVLESMLTEAEAFHSRTGGAPVKVGGRDLSLISAGGDSPVDTTLKGLSSWVDVGIDNSGHPYVRLESGDDRQDYTWTGDDEVLSSFSHSETLSDGTVVRETTTYVNGKPMTYTKTWHHPDGSISWISYDANGEVCEEGKTPAPGGGTPSAGPQVSNSGPTPSAGEQPPGGVSPSTGGDDGGASATPSASDSYVNPDADQASTLHTPTPQQIRARVEFLSGIRARFAGSKPPVLLTDLLPKPGVADPAEPECAAAGCLFFLEVSAPDMSNVHGGDPVPPDLLP